MHDSNVSLKSKVIEFISNHTEEDMLYINNLNVIQIEDISKDYIFGSYGKVEKLSENIEQNIGRAEKFATISYTYTTDNVPVNEFLGFQEISGIKGEHIKTAAVQFYLNPESNFSEVAEKLSNINEYVDKFDRFKLETENETIDVIEKILTKKVSIY